LIDSALEYFYNDFNLGKTRTTKTTGVKMKTLLILAVALISSSAFARPNTANMSCRDATAMVQEKGAIVLSTGNPALYDRFVANKSFCGSDEKTASAYVKTADLDSCRIGYACVDRDGGNSVKYPSEIRSCKEGSFGRADASSYYGSDGTDRTREITVVCQAGKWVPANDRDWKAPKTKGGQVCKNGALDYYPEPDRGQVLPGTIVRQCQAGKWVRIK
jgi:hypothetical protein